MKLLRIVVRLLERTRMDHQWLVRAYGYPTRPYLVEFIMNPSLQCGLLIRAAATSHPVSVLARQLLIHLFACDVSRGAQIEGALYLPHPLGIVIGKGVVLENEIAVYQGVTLGATRSGRYPHIRQGATIYTGATVIGGVDVGQGAAVGAGVVVRSDVPAGAVVDRSTAP